ncbi:hypothetical protein LZ30DRAFT_784783 [Colletotrichum cereale]|nr:hypothetical protein LZ30DRAFT_784783 [Colletotrichum cereale]
MDGITGKISTTTWYAYHNGSYDPFEKVFAGFEMVEQILSVTYRRAAERAGVTGFDDVQANQTRGNITLARSLYSDPIEDVAEESGVLQADALEAAGVECLTVSPSQWSRRYEILHVDEVRR